MKKKMFWGIVPAALILIVLFVLPPSSGELPKAHSLSEKTFLEIDGTKLGLILLSDKTDNPVLLVCGGGPGIPQYLMESLYPSVLPEYFTVCYFDYRGTGLSYDGTADPDSMTADRFIDDTCCTSLQKEYYEMIEAPEKEFFLYEGCAHSPIYEDAERTREILDSSLKVK